MVAFWFLILFLMVAYFIFKIARMYDPTQSYKYVGSIKFLTVFGTCCAWRGGHAGPGGGGGGARSARPDVVVGRGAVARARAFATGTLALVVTIATIIITGVCVANFGKGLKAHRTCASARLAPRGAART